MARAQLADAVGGVAEAQRWSALPEAGPDERREARTRARDWGRFTRNFVVQGTAAEWALCWLADLRRQLDALGGADGAAGAHGSSTSCTTR